VGKVAFPTCPFLARFLRFVWELPHTAIISGWQMEYQMQQVGG
jgi:hypothetical protein